jgi:hypothetical protein
VARGFESKSVAAQQEAVHTAPREADAEEPDPALRARRRKLELSRSDVQRRLMSAHAEAHREILQRALDALEAELASLDRQPGAAAPEE